MCVVLRVRLRAGRRVAEPCRITWRFLCMPPIDVLGIYCACWLGKSGWGMDALEEFDETRRNADVPSEVALGRVFCW